jgi:hypothetical protein
MSFCLCEAMQIDAALDPLIAAGYALPEAAVQRRKRR